MTTSIIGKASSFRQREAAIVDPSVRPRTTRAKYFKKIFSSLANSIEKVAAKSLPRKTGAIEITRNSKVGMSRSSAPNLYLCS